MPVWWLGIRPTKKVTSLAPTQFSFFVARLDYLYLNLVMTWYKTYPTVATQSIRSFRWWITWPGLPRWRATGGRRGIAIAYPWVQFVFYEVTPSAESVKWQIARCCEFEELTSQFFIHYFAVSTRGMWRQRLHRRWLIYQLDGSLLDRSKCYTMNLPWPILGFRISVQISNWLTDKILNLWLKNSELSRPAFRVRDLGMGPFGDALDRHGTTFSASPHSQITARVILAWTAKKGLRLPSNLGLS